MKTDDRKALEMVGAFKPFANITQLYTSTTSTLDSIEDKVLQLREKPLTPAMRDCLLLVDQSLKLILECKR